jgi:hypothetical protein
MAGGGPPPPPVLDGIETPFPSEQVLARISEFEFAAARAMACSARTVDGQVCQLCGRHCRVHAPTRLGRRKTAHA